MLKNFVNYYTYFLYKNMIIASLSSSSVRVDVQRITRDFFLGDNLECTEHNNRAEDPDKKSPQHTTD